ncbi:MAG: hypothetical protein BRC39_06225 [Cyanobacteria bacterium QH_7_48_89]|nr:MAG: hypothetical protein BRC39_06225 [Cyanobacteria bacterium QH_7_48_89]
MAEKNMNDYKQDEQDFVYENSNSLWEGLEPEERRPKIRINVDVDVNLNDRLAEKARKLNKSKSEIIRVLLDRALD